MRRFCLVTWLALAGCSEPAKQLASQVEVLPATAHNRLAIVSASPNPNLAPGKLLVLDLNDGKVREAAVRIGNDPLLERIEQTSELALVDRSHSTILFFDPLTLNLKRELRPLPSVGYTNFSDLLELPNGEMYAVSYETPWLYRLKISDGVQVKRTEGDPASIPLHKYADGDGIPEAHKMVQSGDKVFLSLQRLERGKGFEPSAYSSILAVDPEKNEVVAEHRLLRKGGEEERETCLNPTTPLRTLSDGQIVFGCTGSYNDVDKGGVIGVFDPKRTEQAYRGVKWEQAALQGKPSELIALGLDSFFSISIDNLNRKTSVVHLEKESSVSILSQAPYIVGYRSILYDDARKLLWLGKVTDQGGQVLAMDPMTQAIIRRLDVEYDPVQLEWLD